jgi:hypothetical protein
MKREIGGIYLTYNNAVNQDGIGAQIQRIVSVYSISRLMGLKYHHTYVESFDRQIFNEQDFQRQVEELSNWAKFFDPELDNLKALNFHLKLRLPSLKGRFWIRIFHWFLKIIGIRVLIRLSSPRNFTDKHPDCINAASEIFNIKFLNRPATKKQTDEFVIAVHIRTGELALAQFQNRYLPFSYFEGILSKIIPKISELKVKYRVLIPTEDMHQVISIDDPKIQESIHLNPTNSRIKFVDDSSVILLSEIPSSNMPHLLNSEWLNPADPFEDFVLLATADILILSKSSFSFLAGLANPHSLKIFHPFWHAVPSHWVDGSILNDKSLQEIQHFLASPQQLDLKE